MATTTKGIYVWVFVSMASLAVTLLPSCMPKTPGAGSSTAVGGAVAVVHKPIAEVIPHGVSYALVVARGQWAARALSDMLKPFGVAEEMSRHAAKELGFDPFDAAALAQAGFAPKREVGIYGHGMAPTLVLPVADETKMRATLGRILGAEKVGVRQFRGHTVTTWRDSFLSIAYVQVDGWLFVHLSFGKSKNEDAWILAMLDPEGGVGPALKAASAHSKSRDVLGFVQLPKFAKAIAQLEKLHVGTCPAVDGTISLFASLEDGGLQAGMFVPLRAPFRTELGRHVGRQPGAAYLALRDKASAFASLGLDLTWLSAQKGDALQDCTLLFWMLEAVQLWDQKDPMSQLPIGGNYFNSYHVAVSAVDVQAGDVKGAAWFGLSGSRGLDVMLGMATVGMKKQRRKVNGRSVTRLSLGKLVPMLGKVDYIVSQDAVRVGVGSGMIEAMLAQPSQEDVARARRPGRDLFAAGLRPWKATQTQGVVANLASVLQIPKHLLLPFLSALDRVALSIRLEPDGLRVTSGFHLR